MKNTKYVFETSRPVANSNLILSKKKKKNMVEYRY